ncbi:MAG: ribonucleotide-diphosphate reductase subunit alpha [Gammaproteobacteria bacterium 39-13]|nr:ribonucleoside-diphosphate reductase subunit alpha [Gammaproteobacteria bacterium]OJV91661.1 MAG: ribonucleotide-diphosphate reductase subunit alpha [Gammaproteobacteria bacterium 39-13]
MHTENPTAKNNDYMQAHGESFTGFAVTPKPGQLHVMRRDNRTLVPFNTDKIQIALTKAYLAVEGGNAAASRRVHEVVEDLTAQVTKAVSRHLSSGGIVRVEEVQDQVELALMRAGLHKVARTYILYREERRQARESNQTVQNANADALHVTLDNGQRVPLDEQRLRKIVDAACQTLDDVDAEIIITETKRNIFDGIKASDLRKALIMSARTKIEFEPNYSYVAARLLLDDLHNEALKFLAFPVPENEQEKVTLYPQIFKQFIHKGIELELLSPELRDFDLDQLGQALQPSQDHQFTYLGLQTLYDRYFLHHNGVRFELPQIFFMRVAMGLAGKEADKNARAIEFYNLLSSFDYMSSTPTLFNSGTTRPQLSSCFLTTVPDDLEGIYSALKDNALLSKFAGGLGNDWTYIRAMGAHIKGTNGKSQGVVPFLKVANDTAVAVNQGGKRKGAMCAYLETWHLDIEEFLELRKNTGDDRRRTHDMNTANWIPDLFMKRVMENKEWTLFSPDETPDLHDLYGEAFEQAYHTYEEKAQAGLLRNYKQIPAVNLWRKMLGLIFETGHPWVTFKDPCNLRSPQQHAGVIHSSNLCTEITLNTSVDEIAVCNLGSINLAQHVTEKGLDLTKLQKTIQTAVRMLDNVIDINYYSVPQARRSNLKHRPVGLGLMGFQDALYKLDIPYCSMQAVEFADKTMEAISYYAIKASTDLAEERGAYATFEGSLWSKGILPIDSIALLAKYRGKYLELDTSQTLDWKSLRERVKTVGIRNSNVMAIAPTATISNICGIGQSIEPTYQNLYVKSNLSGEFTVVNPYLVKDLKKLKIWDEVLVNDLKYFNGSVQQIDRIPAELKAKYATVFEIDPQWLIEAGARRQKWIDQSQSLNIYIDKPSGKKIDAVYKLAWIRGLKTTYYARTLGASDAEKSTISRSTLNAVKANLDEVAITAPQVCPIDDPTCEACQ